ncbi:phosphatase [Aquisalimonas sp. APHAB1-3]|uniref:phosphatase n=1 Tax=Aquisalimonas sp. APHAB1-3 TaxID=3402080 RepID=UPI003AAB9591
MTGYPLVTGDTSNEGIDRGLAHLRDSGATCLVTVAEAHELKDQQANDLSSRAKALFGRHGWLHAPIQAGQTPDDLWELYWSGLAPLLLHKRLAAGEMVVVQGLRGRGRTGVATCRLLVESGVPPETALATVRKVRPGAVRTAEQEAYVQGLLDHQSVIDQINTCPEVANRLTATARRTQS